MSPFFSIAVPAYKDTYLGECIDSILAQTYTDFELIIVNDASPCDLDAIVQRYSDPRIRYYRNEKNFGAVNVVGNWNKCLGYAKGEYLICMGDDDKLMPGCLQEYASLIEKHPGLGVYHAWTEIIDENSGFCNVTAARCEYESVYSFIWHRWNGRVQQYVGDFLYDVKRLRDAGGFFFLPLAWGSDDITAVIAAKKDGIANTQKPCFCYRINRDTISNTGSVDLKLKAVAEERRWYEAFLADEPDGDLDRKFRMCLVRQLPHHFDKKLGLTVTVDLRNHSFLRLFWWMFRLRQYGLNMKILAYAWIETLKTRR